MPAVYSWGVVTLLNPTPPERMVDAQGRPYFLWDCELTLADFRQRLRDPDADVRAYFLGKLMRQAKPDDVFDFVMRSDIEASWSRLAPYLGERRDFWAWLLETWRTRPRERK